MTSQLAFAWQCEFASLLRVTILEKRFLSISINLRGKFQGSGYLIRKLSSKSQRVATEHGAEKVSSSDVYSAEDVHVFQLK